MSPEIEDLIAVAGWCLALVFAVGYSLERLANSRLLQNTHRAIAAAQTAWTDHAREQIRVFKN